MPKTQVRQAVASFLDPNLGSNITYLGNVYQALPKVANEEDLYNLQPPGQGVGAVIYCFIENQREHRIADGGAHSGKKFRIYGLGLLCILKSDLTDSLAGEEAFDAFIDSLTARIQSDRNAGAPSVVFQWGEGTDRGGDDLRFDYPIPKTLKGGVQLFQAVGRVTVCEVLTT